jgi:NADP-dependent 3-hydroxy acid dehydrogenase YdfG
MGSLDGRVVAITGASSGIGEATALACAQAGAAVALAARRVDRIDGLAQRIADAGGRALAIATDVRDEAQATAFVERAHDELGGLHALVNNAGVMRIGPVEGAPTDDWRLMVDVNVLGLLYCTHAALPLLKAAGGGDIVNVSSVGGRVATKYGAVYSLTKFGIGAFSEALRQEHVDDGIRVTLVEPGRVTSELRDHQDPGELRQLLSQLKAVTPLEAADIANAIVYGLAQPPHVSISEMLIRPTNSPM